RTHSAGRNRGQPLGGLVVPDGGRVAGESAHDRAHLLLAAREALRLLAPAVAEDREVLEERVVRPARAGSPGERRQSKVLVDVEVRKALSALGDVAEAEARDAVRWVPGAVTPC